MAKIKPFRHSRLDSFTVGKQLIREVANIAPVHTADHSMTVLEL